MRNRRRRRRKVWNMIRTKILYQRKTILLDYLLKRESKFTDLLIK